MTAQRHSRQVKAHTRSRPMPATAGIGAVAMALACITGALASPDARADRSIRSDNGKERLRVTSRGKTDAIVSERGEKVGYCAPRGAQKRCEARIGGERVVWWTADR